MHKGKASFSFFTKTALESHGIVLDQQKARGSALMPWAALGAATGFQSWVRIYKITRTHFSKKHG